MARKRSLKDAAADRLVEKKRAVPKTPVSPKVGPAAEADAVTPVPTEPAEERAIHPLAPAEALKVPGAGKKGCPPSLWGAILIAIGFAGGFFFGMGQAIGSANMAYLLIGIAGGYCFGRFYRII